MQNSGEDDYKKFGVIESYNLQKQMSAWTTKVS